MLLNSERLFQDQLHAGIHMLSKNDSSMVELGANNGLIWLTLEHIKFIACFHTGEACSTA